MTAAAPARGNLLTAEEVAARWQVSRSQVYALVRSGKIPTVVIGRYYRFRLDALEEWELAGGTLPARESPSGIAPSATVTHRQRPPRAVS